MGLGLQGPMGVAGIQDELQQVLAQRVAAQKYADDQRQREADNALKQQNLALDQRHETFLEQPQAQAPERPYVVGGNLVSPTGGVLYSAPEKPAAPPRPFVVGGNLVNPDGGVLYSGPKEAKPDPFGQWKQQYDYELAHPKPTSGAAGGTQGLQRARAESAINMLNRLKEVHGRLQAGEGPGQLVRGAVQRVKGALNMENAATEYQKLRKATAVALAVAIQGSRPSDADAEAMASLMPDYNTPKEVADHLFTGALDQLQGTMTAMGGQPHTLQPPGSAAPQEFDFVNGKLVPRTP